MQRRGPGVLRAGVRRDPPRHAQFAAKISNSEAHFGVRFGPAGRIQETKPGEDLFFFSQYFIKFLLQNDLR